MAYSTSYNASPKVPTFVTKVAHDVTLTDTDSRVFIKNIKTGVTLDHFKYTMEKYGPVQVYLYEHGNKDNGWAWVGFENKEIAIQAVKDYEQRAEEEEEEEDKTVKEDESNTAYEGNMKTERNISDRDVAHNKYAENEENNENFEEPNEENDETDEQEEEEEEEEEE